MCELSIFSAFSVIRRAPHEFKIACLEVSSPQFIFIMMYSNPHVCYLQLCWSIKHFILKLCVSDGFLLDVSQ